MVKKRLGLEKYRLLKFLLSALNFLLDARQMSARSVRTSGRSHVSGRLWKQLGNNSKKKFNCTLGI